MSAPSSKSAAVTRTIWAIWIAAAMLGAVGMRNFRVSNSMDAWMPDLATPGPYASYVVIGFPNNKADAAAVAERLRALPAVQFCLDPASVRATQAITDITPDNLVVGKDGDYSGIFCFRRATATNKEFVGEVGGALKDLAAAGTFAVAGPAVFQQAMDAWSQYRLGLILGSILVIGGLLLHAITGSMRLAAVSMTAISCSQLVFMGALCWMKIPLDMSLALVPPMMMGMGFSYAAHRALRRQSLSVLIVCGLAAAAGIGSFVTADLLPVRHFAIAGVPGLMLVWLAAVTLVHPDSTARRRRVPWLRYLRNICLEIVAHHRRRIITIAAAVTIVGFAMSPYLRVESNPLNFFPRTSTISRDFDCLDRRLTGMLPSQIIARGDADPRAMLLATPGMRKVIDVTPWIGSAVGRTYWCLANNDAVNTLADYVPSWQSWALAHHVTLEWRGVAAQIHRSGASIFTTAAESLPSMALLIAFIIAIRIRRLRAVLVGTWVTMLPVAALVLIAVAAQWELGPVTMMIGSITVGVAVDDVLHLLTTYQRRGSLQRTLIECWKPCVGSSLATAVSFSLFMLSPFGPTYQFGMLMALATCLAMFANQLVLPVLPLL